MKKYKTTKIMNNNQLQSKKRNMSAPNAIVKDSNNHLSYAISCAIQFTDPLSVSIDTGAVKVFQQNTDGSWTELKQGTTRNGYQVVHPLTVVNGKTARHLCYVHRLVASTYCDNPKGNSYVDHIDGDRQNNAPTNLRWVTARENQLYRRLSELKKLKPHNRGCTRDAIKQGRYLKLSATGEEPVYFQTLTDAAKALGCTSQNISMCLRRNYRVCGWNVELVRI